MLQTEINLSMPDTIERNDKVPNVLINNAGITKDQLFLRMKDEDWDDVIILISTSVFNINNYLLNQWLKERSGSINISSVAGLMGNPGQVNYSASKAGLVALPSHLQKRLLQKYHS